MFFFIGEGCLFKLTGFHSEEFLSRINLHRKHTPELRTTVYPHIGLDQEFHHFYSAETFSIKTRCKQMTPAQDFRFEASSWLWHVSTIAGVLVFCLRAHNTVGYTNNLHLVVPKWF